MKNLLTILLIAGLVFTTQAQSKETRKLSSFSTISAHEGIDVFVKKGSSEEVRIEADNVSTKEVLTEISGGNLKIHLEGNNHRNVKVKVWVTYTKLSGVSASSAADLTVEGRVTTSGDFYVKASSAGDVRISVKAKDVDISASSAGDIDVDVTANSIDASASSAGDINIKGSAKSADVSVSSSGDFNGFNFSCENADLRASSGAGIEIEVSEQLDAKASSGASIRYKGNPRSDVNSSSGGSVRKSK